MLLGTGRVISIHGNQYVLLNGRKVFKEENERYPGYPRQSGFHSVGHQKLNFYFWGVLGGTDMLRRGEMTPLSPRRNEEGGSSTERSVNRSLLFNFSLYCGAEGLADSRWLVVLAERRLPTQP